MKETFAYGLAIAAILMILVFAAEEMGVFTSDWFGRIFRFLK
ncbi:MAG: hypothetical protein R3229_12325 [Alphaproteobacteria bacterium]|nr:hypothetical protein [Alphaproteobacteria bacterium]